MAHATNASIVGLLADVPNIGWFYLKGMEAGRWAAEEGEMPPEGERAGSPDGVSPATPRGGPAKSALFFVRNDLQHACKPTTLAPSFIPSLNLPVCLRYPHALFGILLAKARFRLIGLAAPTASHAKPLTPTLRVRFPLPHVL